MPLPETPLEHRYAAAVGDALRMVDASPMSHNGLDSPVGAVAFDHALGLALSQARPTGLPPAEQAIPAIARVLQEEVIRALGFEADALARAVYRELEALAAGGKA